MYLLTTQSFHLCPHHMQTGVRKIMLLPKYTSRWLSFYYSVSVTILRKYYKNFLPGLHNKLNECRIPTVLQCLTSLNVNLFNTINILSHWCYLIKSTN